SGSDTSTDRPRVHVATQPTRAPVTSTPAAVHEQTRIALGTTGAIAVENGTVWVVTATGVEVFDAATMESRGSVPLALPTVALATSTDGVWILSGANRPLFGSEVGPPYHLIR